MIVGTLPHDLALAALLFEQLLFRQPLSLRLGPRALGLHGAARFRLRKSFAGFGGALRLVEGELRLHGDSLQPLGVEGWRSLLPLRLLRASRRRRLRALVLTLALALRRNLSRASERGFRGLAIRPQLLAVRRGALLCFSRGAPSSDNSDGRAALSPSRSFARCASLSARTGITISLETPSRSAMPRCSAKSLA
jgi:hypothetical protein